jgi:hypothetical protein
MKKTITAVLIASILAVTASAQTIRMVDLGRDKDGDLWQMNLEHVLPTDAGTMIGAMQVKIQQTATLAVILEFDCKSRRARNLRSLVFINGSLFRETDENGSWQRANGLVAKALDTACKEGNKTLRLPANFGSGIEIN